MGSGASSPEDTQRWVTLKEKMESSIFGQHIAIGEVYFRLYSHYRNPKPEKALVIICNGSLGTGKSYFCQLIVNEIYDKGFENPACKLFIGPRDFPDENEIPTYKSTIQKTIETSVKSYQRSCFIFDEIDKAPLGMLDVLTPYVGPFAIANKVDYRFSTFIFISNFGGTDINSIVLNHLENKQLREMLMLIQFQRVLEEIALKEKGGLKDSEIITKKLIDHHVPFLPLEKEHIRKCVEVQYKVKDNAIISKVLEIMPFEPEHNPIFAADGAKNVDVHLDFARALLRIKR